MMNYKMFLSNTNKPVFILTFTFAMVFCLWALFDLTSLSQMIDALFSYSIQYFGYYWQILLLGTFLISLLLCFFPGSRAKLGGLEKPEYNIFQWGSMIMCTLLAGGGVFWAAGEPMAHFLSTPPSFAGYSGIFSQDQNIKAVEALAQSYLHWGFLAWAILGSLTTPVLMYYHYEKGFPLAPRTLLYPLFGKRALSGVIGWLADASCIVAVVAGTVGPIGFLGLQVGYGLNVLFGTPNDFTVQSIIIVILMGIYIISAITGLSKGIKFLSQLNVVLGVTLLIFLLIFGATVFVFSSFFKGQSVMLVNFLKMSLFRGDLKWLSSWTVFFWGWFLGYGPLMAVFIAKVSRGRSIRGIIVLLSIVAPLITCFWFTIVGGNGIYLDMTQGGVVSNAMKGFDLPAALLSITQHFGYIISLLFLILTILFVATTGDSMAYTISVSLSSREDKDPSKLIRLFWGAVMGVMALILIRVGNGSIGKLQNFIVITSVPVSIILLPSLWGSIYVVWLKQKELGRKRCERKNNIKRC